METPKTAEDILGKHIKDSYPGLTSWNRIINGKVDCDTIIVVAAMEEYGNQCAEQATQDEREMYKECLEKFLPVEKWDEATAFLSSYGSGLAKELQKKGI